jgi:hypothetical protein
MPFAIVIPADKQRQAYDFYVNHPSKSVRDIIRFLGVSQSTFSRLRDRWGWPRRADAMTLSAKDRASPGGSVEGADPADGPSPPSSLRAAAVALATATRSHIAALVREQRSGRTDHDKASKALASYAKTLTTAQALLEQESLRLDDDGHDHAGHRDDPRTIHELRDELARHLERIIAEEEACGRDGLLV